MSSFISSFKAPVGALLLIAAIEIAVYAAWKPNTVERSKYLDWHYASNEIFHRLLIYSKLRTFGNSAPDIVQVGDSNGFHGVRPEIVMKHLGGLSYLNMSCCGNIDFGGYYDMAKFMLDRSPRTTALVFYIQIDNLPISYRPDLRGGRDKIHDSFAVPWTVLDPPSQSLRPTVTDVVFTAGGLLAPLRPGLTWSGMAQAMIASAEANRGWWSEHDPHPTKSKMEELRRDRRGEQDTVPMDLSSPASPYFSTDAFGRRRFTPLVTFGEFAALAASHGAKFIIVFHPDRCKSINEESRLNLLSTFAQLKQAHPNVLILPEQIFEHLAGERFSVASHLRVAY